MERAGEDKRGDGKKRERGRCGRMWDIKEGRKERVEGKRVGA